MARKSRPTWLQKISSLFVSKRTSTRTPRTRRLRAEFLERRAVLSVAPLGDDGLGPTLAEYLAQEQEMGPAVPAELASSIDAEAGDAALNQILFLSQAEGEDEGGNTEEGEGEGGGEGEGSCGGGGEGEGEPGEGEPGEGEPESEDPTISDVEVENVDGTITVNGTIDDDTDVSGLTMTLDHGIGEITINEDGTFTINITDPEGHSTFTIAATDSNGNTTTFTFEYAA